MCYCAVNGISTSTLLILHLHTPLHTFSSTRYIYQVAFLPFGLGPHHNAVDPEGDGAELLSDPKAPRPTYSWQEGQPGGVDDFGEHQVVSTTDHTIIGRLSADAGRTTANAGANKKETGDGGGAAGGKSSGDDGGNRERGDSEGSRGSDVNGGSSGGGVQMPEILANWLSLSCFGFLNDHTLHHLFPAVDHSKHRLLRRVFEDTCAEFNVPYEARTFSAMAAGFHRYCQHHDVTVAETNGVDGGGGEGGSHTARSRL